VAVEELPKELPEELPEEVDTIDEEDTKTDEDDDCGSTT
jgi:hypothetical protein